MDLFEQVDTLPHGVQAIITEYDSEDTNYENCKELIKALNHFGYTCDYGLDGVPFDLKIVEEFNEDMLAWIADDNVIEIGENAYTEQTTQWRKVFTKQELIDFFIREYLVV